MYEGTVTLLHEADSTFPCYKFPKNFIEIKEFCGGDYGLYTTQGIEARRLVEKTEGIKLDGTYTGKAFAAMLAMIKKGLQDKTHLFWDGYCSDEFADILTSIDYKTLPHALQHYFTEPVQELDNK